MASNGRLSIFARSSPPRAKAGASGLGRRVSWFYAAVALASATALHALPLPLFLLLALALICLLLAPRTPLALLVLLLTLSPLRALIATEARLDLPLDIGQILLALYLGYWLACRVIQRRPLRLRPEPVLMTTLAACAVFSLGAWQSDHIGDWLTEWLKWATMALLIWQLSLSERRNWRWLAFAVLASAVGNAIVGLYIFFGGSGADHLLILGRYFRAFGAFGQPNPFGGFMGITLPLALMVGAALLHRIARDARARRPVPPPILLAFAGAAISAAIIAAALIASWSRGAWLGFAVSLAVMLVALPRRLLHGLASALLLAAIVGAMWQAGLVPQSVVNRLTTAAGDLFTISDVRGVDFTPANYAVIERLAHWQAAIAMARDHPFFGVGLGGYALAYDAYRLINWEEPLGHAHNHYLNFLAEAGILGLAAYLAFWVVIFRLTWRTLRHPDALARAAAIGLLGSWTYIAAHSVFDNLFVNNLFLHIGVLLGILAILHRQIASALKVE